MSQYQKRRLGKTFVAVSGEQKRVLGYYTLAAGAVAFENIPAETSHKLPRHPVPVILLARLAVDQTAQSKALGQRLLMDALERALSLSGELGVYAVEVDALDEAAAAFYRKYGFVPLVDDPHHLYLPMATVEEVLGE